MLTVRRQAVITIPSMSTPVALHTRQSMSSMAFEEAFLVPQQAVHLCFLLLLSSLLPSLLFCVSGPWFSALLEHLLTLAWL